MKDYIKLQTFSRIHQANLMKDVLEQNDIEAVVINERDSLFLIGDIELYVKKGEKAKANKLINEFNGLTKINSFFIAKPIVLLQNYLKDKGLETILKKTEDDNYVLDNYELYIANESVADVVPYLTGEKLNGWKKIDTCSHTRQARFRLELLDNKEIDTIIIKKKNSEFHVEEINLFVEVPNAEKATSILTDLDGWIIIKTYDKLHKAEIREDLLGKNSIRAIIKSSGEAEFNLFVKEINKDKSIKAINEQKEWHKIKSYNNYYNALYTKEKLESLKIDATIICRKDSAFFLGEYDLYVEDLMTEKAKNIINES